MKIPAARDRRKKKRCRDNSALYLWILVAVVLCSESDGIRFRWSSAASKNNNRIRLSSKQLIRDKVGSWKQRLFWKDSASSSDHLTADNSILLACRGGGSDSNSTNGEVVVDEDLPAESRNTTRPKAIKSQTDTSSSDSAGVQQEVILTTRESHNQRRQRTRTRHTSDMLHNLIERSAVIVPESVSLRELMTQRSQDYMEDLYLKQMEAMDSLSSGGGRKKKLPHPKKVLHFLAPKIPAIKHSPDVNLRIQTARFDIDSGIAACLIGTVAQVCERYDTSVLQQSRRDEDADETSEEPASAAMDLVKDRRFEQLVECLACGVDVKHRKREYLALQKEMKRTDDDSEGNSENDDIEELLEGDEVISVKDGLNIRDACRAAWGVAILGAHHCGTLGGTRVMDLLIALSLRVRELLLSRLQMFFQGDLMADIIHVSERESPLHVEKQTPEERLNELAEELAEDAAAAMWAFACVRACTGLRSDALFDTCCSILCRDPVDLRKRALEKGEGSTIEVNDVVDRLAYSEAQIKEAESLEGATNKTTINTTDKLTAKMTAGSEDKEALVDWLSPNELTDVLWALALHGHSATSTRGETVLSENGSALREIAFDRLMELLQEDFFLLERLQQQAAESEGELVPSTEEYVTSEGETMTVEVVDAAALLASELAAKSEVVTTADEIVAKTASSSRSEGGLVSGVEEVGELVSGVEEVEVLVDAATILSSTGEQMEEHDILAADQDVLIDQDSEQTAKLSEMFSDDEDSIVSTLSEIHSGVDEESDETTLTTGDQLYFSPHDLCSLAWAVTELKDSLRFQIVDLVVGIFARLGEDSFDTLRGADLSNLAWAIARQSNDARPWMSQAENPHSLQLTLWVVRRALIASGGNEAALTSHNIHILDPFQPPELSRLIWAVAMVVRSHTDKRDGHFPDVEDLAINALVAASSHLSLFSPEDLVRVFWAFLELSDMDEAMSFPDVGIALGRVYSSVESSITRWESGHYSQKVDEVEAESSRGGFNAVASFFLRPRLSRQMLDQSIEEYNDLEEEDPKISRLPRLRDLSVDPSTLAKAAGGFAKLTEKHPNMRGSSTLTRVVLKLLSSKNGRLLQEFSMANLIRACEAAAINDSTGRGLDPVVGQFVRRFLQLLNEANTPSIDSDADFRADLRLASASPEEIATLLWSLGELGARHLVADQDQGSAHRKLRLVVASPLLTDDQLSHLSASSTLKLLRGLVGMNEMSCDKLILTTLLERIEPMIPSMQDESDLCELAESLAVITQSLSAENRTITQALPDATHVAATTNGTSTSAATSSESSNKTASVIENGNSTQHNDNTTYSASELDVLQTISSRMLSSLATHASERVSNLKADSLCRLLGVFSLLPFQADGLIKVCDEEVSRRESLLKSAAATASVEDLLRQAAKNAMAANTTVFGKDEDSSSPLAALKLGLKSIFSPAAAAADREDDETSEEMRRFTMEIGSLLNRVTASVTQVDTCMEQIGTASNVHTDTALQRIMEGTNFELGRCRDLIDNYRRIEFSTGKRTSRYDYERGRHIGKRLLSRLIPR